MLASTDWNAIGATAGVLGVALVVGGAVVKTVRNWIGTRSLNNRRIDRLEIRLFGLPADPETGAKKLDGEFDRIDKRLDALPGEVIAAMGER